MKQELLPFTFSPPESTVLTTKEEQEDGCPGFWGRSCSAEGKIRRNAGIALHGKVKTAAKEKEAGVLKPWKSWYLEPG